LAVLEPATCQVSIVFPCLNEESSVGECIRAAFHHLDEARLVGEVIVCDNGSRDRSSAIATEAGARVVHQAYPGYGAALAAGIDAARGQYIVMADADGSYDLHVIGEMIDLLESGAELVVGNRFRGQISAGSMPWLHRHVGNPVLSFLLNIFFGTRVGDAHCGLRAFTRDAYARMDLRTTGMEFASEMIVRGARAGLHIAELPVDYHPRVGQSKLRRYRDGWRHLRFLLMYSPTWLFLVPSAVIGMVGLLVLISLAFTRVELLGRYWDMHLSAVASLCTVLAVQVAWLGLSARTVAVLQGLIAEDAFITRFYQRFTLEMGLVGAGGLLLVGLAIMLGVVWQWASQGFPELDAIRVLLLGTTLVIVGVQSAFNAFFLSLLSNGARATRRG
jgi:glycosyltransferase involved in cell wall biosynthesis